MGWGHGEELPLPNYPLRVAVPFSLPSALVGVASGGESGRSRRRLNRSIRSGARSRGARDGRQFSYRLAHGRLS
jgi:hypothetical protein